MQWAFINNDRQVIIGNDGFIVEMLYIESMTALEL
jgi:hypothetical protein